MDMKKRVQPKAGHVPINPDFVNAPPKLKMVF